MGLIVAEDGRLLLQHRDDNPAITGANLWGFFGGHVEPGEAIDAAFLRETDEELGWRPRHFEHYLTSEVEPREGDKGYGWHLTSHIFAAHLDVPVEALTLGEGQAMALYAPDALPDGDRSGPRGDHRGVRALRRVQAPERDWDFISATALLVDAQGRFLLQHRDDKPGDHAPGALGLVRRPRGAIRDAGGRLPARDGRGAAPGGRASHELYMTARLHSSDADDAGNQLVYIYAAPLDVPLDGARPQRRPGMDVFAPDALPEDIVPQLRALIELFAGTETVRSAGTAAVVLNAVQDLRASASTRPPHEAVVQLRYTVMLCPH